MTAETTSSAPAAGATLVKLTPNLMVEDVNQTVAFYRDVLGFTVAATAPEQGTLDWAMLQRDGAVLMFQSRQSLEGEIPALRGAPLGAVTLYVEVKGVGELYEALRRNVEIVAEPHTTFYGMREFSFKDCSGYVLGFAEALPPAAEGA